MSLLTTDTARAAQRRLRELAKPARVAVLQSFFRTGPGQYGAGDRFLGLTMPEIRRLASEFRDLPLTEIEALLESKWHESRMLGVVLLASQYARADARARERIYRLYLRRTDRINNWDLVDVTAPQVVGGHLLKRSRAPLRRLARSRNLWERRIAIVATQHFIRHGEFEDTLAIASLLLHDRHDLIHKATGWMLREVGNRDERVLRGFLDEHAGEMPRTMLRYAIEKLPASHRKRYMSARVNDASEFRE